MTQPTDEQKARELIKEWLDKSERHNSEVPLNMLAHAVLISCIAAALRAESSREYARGWNEAVDAMVQRIRKHDDDECGSHECHTLSLEEATIALKKPEGKPDGS